MTYPALVGRPTVDSDLEEAFARIKALEASPGGGNDGPWHNVGDPGEPPFENSWTNALGDEAPVSFILTANGWVQIRGGFTGGADGTTVFTLPVGYRPAYRQEMVIPTTSATDFATVVVGTDGTVVFGTVV